jgi:hypothetical protein
MARASKTSTSSITSVFGSAPVITVAVPASKSKAVEIEFEGVEDVAALTAVKKAIEGFLEDAMAQLKAAALEEFIATGMKIKRRPETFNGVEGIGRASIQLKANSAKLSDDAIAVLEEHNIPLETTDVVTETFAFAPEYANDPIFVQKMEQTLGSALVALQDERGPIIRKQVGVTKTAVTDLGLEAIFTKSEEIIRALVPLAFTQSVTAKLKTGDLRPALQLVDAKFFADPAETAVKAKKQKVA